MLIQIYEIQNRDEAEKLVEIGVDHIGSVLTEPDGSTCRDLFETIRFVSESGRKSSLIPLFQDVEQISIALDRYRPDIVHFCEALSENGAQQEREKALKRQHAIRERFPEIKIMRSIPIGRAGCADEIPSLEIAKMFETASDFFLTDTLLSGGNGNSDGDQPVNGFVGITGETCDWTVAKALVEQSKIPVILAGGISPENVGEGVIKVSPAGVDSCTLTNAVDETGTPVRFKKDMEKVKRLVASARHTKQENI